MARQAVVAGILKTMGEPHYSLPFWPQVPVRFMDGPNRADLEAANRVKSEFLATVSHELRTPVSIVMAYADLLRRPHELPEGVAESAVEEIAAAAERLAQLIDDILAFSRLRAGEMSPRAEILDLRLVAEEVVDHFRVAARGKSLALDLRCPEMEVRVRADPEHMRQVLLQLVSNALKFTDSGGVTVTVAGSRHGGLVVVEDTGVGIAAPDQELIFQQFRQADQGISRRFEGAGLGLTIARSLVEMQGGNLGLRSIQGVGSTFWFTVPAGTDAA